MAQAATELIDNAAPANAPLADTDDLLSQLAGNEIDRLLAEGDAQAEPPAAAPAQSAPEPMPAASAPAPQPPPPEPASPAIAEGPERTALLQAAGFADTATAPPAPVDASQDPEPAGPERSALLVAAGFEAQDGEAPFDNVTDVESDYPAQPAPLPFFLKPLEWINAPLNACSPQVRQILGRAGIVTLLNALAVLGYVVLFRKH